MDGSLPLALIIGIDNFVAKKLAEELVKKDIGVIGVGDFVMELKSLENFRWVDSLNEVEGDFNYVFDFRGELGIWDKDKIKGEKVSFISVDDDGLNKGLRERVDDLDFNWRLIEAKGVYGKGMEDINFISELFRSAVKNKNLEVPLPEQKLRLLYVDDLVEVILRASFLSNTEKKKYLILGKDERSEEVARILIDKAKMTRLKVFQKKFNLVENREGEFEDSQKKLRWKAKISFKDEIDDVLQYFFSEIDSESRKKKKEKKKYPWEKVEEKKESISPKVEVIPEEEVDDDEWQINNFKDSWKGSEAGDENNSLSLDNENDIDEEELIEGDNGDEILEEGDDEGILEKKEVINKKNNFVERKGILGILEKIFSRRKKKEKKMSLWGKNNRFWATLIILGVLLLLLIVPIDWGLNSYLTIRNIRNVPKMILTKKYVQAGNLIDKNLNKLTDIDNQISDWGLNKLSWLRNYQNTLRVMGELLEVERKVIEVIKPADLLMGGIFEGKDLDWEESLSLLEEELVALNSRVGILQARLAGDLDWLPGRWRSEVQREEKKLSEIKKKLGLGVEAMEILPEFLGLDGRRREYLLLFQNETELRAGGGFIGSYGLLSFENGKLVDLEVKDIYEADGQLKGHVEPPLEIKNHLGEANWYMRDANWKADFREAATDIQWFLAKETDKKVDGVIGVNLATAREIVGVIGEVYVPDFEERITKDNLYEQAEFYAEKKFFPGSNQKASFLGGLGMQIFEEVRALDISRKAEMMGVIIDLLEKNEIKLAFNNVESDRKMTELGWSGAIYRGECESENCIMDYLYVVESNFGVNKANYFLYRNIEELVEISNNSISRIVKINYENTAKSDKWPGGDYKNYVRVYLPLEVNLSQVTVMDGDDPTIKKVYKDDEIRIREINGKKEIGFLMKVPINKKRTIELRYSSSISLASKDKFSYVNYVQRQSGFGETNLVNLVSFPDEWQIVQVEPMASLMGDKLLFNQKLSKDIRMGVELER